MKNTKQKIIRIVYLCTGILYLAIVVCATVYAQTAHMEALPQVELGVPGAGSVPIRYVKTNKDGGYYIDTVVQEDGPWGKKYFILQVHLTSYGMLDEENLYVSPNTPVEWPIVIWSSEELVDGMEVRLR